VYVHMSICCSSDKVAANVSYVNSVNDSSCHCPPPNAKTAPCPINRYCHINDPQHCNHVCVTLPGYITPKSNYAPAPINYCLNQCNLTIGEVPRNIPGGCQCTCPTCFTAPSNANSSCSTFDTACCGAWGAFNTMTMQCVCQSGFRLSNYTCIGKYVNNIGKNL
jgi:hypothetical protein